MTNPVFDTYCSQVCGQLRYRPGRAGVRAELLSHMEDRAEALTAQGADPSAAAQQAVAAMGDPEELGRALDRVHPPLLCWGELVSRVWVFLLAIPVALILVPTLALTLFRAIVHPSPRDLPQDQIVRASTEEQRVVIGERVVVVTDAVVTADGTLHLYTLNYYKNPLTYGWTFTGFRVSDEDGTRYHGNSSTLGGLISYGVDEYSGFPTDCDTAILTYQNAGYDIRLTLPLEEVSP